MWLMKLQRRVKAEDNSGHATSNFYSRLLAYSMAQASRSTCLTSQTEPIINWSATRTTTAQLKNGNTKSWIQRIWNWFNSVPARMIKVRIMKIQYNKLKATICKPNFWRMWCSCSISDIDTLLIWLLNYMSFEDRLEQDLKLINLIRFYYCFRLLLTYWISLWNSVDILQTMFVMNTEQSLIITNIFCIFEHKIDCKGILWYPVDIS